MTVTVLKLSDADAYLKNISIRSIKDVRALDVDLMLVLVNGDRIIISSGAVSAMSAPESSLQFADGQLPLASVFQQIDKIDVSPEANLTVSSKEITRYNQNNARNKKARKNDEEDSDKPVVVEDGERDPSAAAETSGSSGNTERPNFSPTRSPDNQSQIADAEINSQHEKNWGVQWPIAAGALALLAAAGGGGGGGGSGGGNGGSAANGGSGGAGSGAGAAAAGSAGAGTVDPSAAVIRGNAALGAIKNANVTAYDAAGNAISDTVAVVDGKYTLTLKHPLYKGPMMLVVRDNTPGGADNYIDEGSLQLTDLGPTPLRALVMASGVNQNVNVTPLRLPTGADDGIASDDGITRQLNTRLELMAPREGGAELHLQLQAVPGTTNDTLAAINTAGGSRIIAPGSWITLRADEHLVMSGNTKAGNGKVALKLRHIDAAGNYQEISQTFVTDSTGTLELVNLLVQRNSVLQEARKATAQAQTAFDTATATERTAKQTVLAAAQRVEQAARKAHEEAVVSVRTALTTAREDGTYRLDEVLNQNTDKAYFPAIVNQLSRATNVEELNHQSGLKSFVTRAIEKADAAVTKASLYGDDPAKPAPDQEDFFAMGVLGLDNNAVAMAAVVDAIKGLPKDKTNAIGKIQAVTDAYLKVLALANERTDTADTDLPAATVYAILGVKPALTPAAATILGNVLDDKKTQDVDTILKLNLIAASAQRIAEQATHATPAEAPTVDDFRNLGINGVTDDNVAAVRNSLYDVPTILRGANRSDRVIGTVDTLREVKSIVALNIGQLQVLINYAERSSPINPDSPLQTEPVKENYSPPPPLTSAVTESNLPSINSALRAVGSANMNSWKKVGDIVASYGYQGRCTNTATQQSCWYQSGRRNADHGIELRTLRRGRERGAGHRAQWQQGGRHGHSLDHGW